MKPIDYRNETWEGLQERLAGLRLTAWQAWQRYGPGTTREVSARCGMDLLTFRPRTTELYQLGLLAVVPGAEQASEGLYRALTLAEAQTAFTAAKLAAVQPELALA